MKLRSIPALLALALAQHAGATLVDQGLSTLDTGTGLQWLDLTQSSGLTYDQVTAQLGAGGSFEGYRYASAAEVQAVFSQFGIPLVTPTEYYGTAAVPVAAAVKSFEALFATGGGSFFDALVADTVPGDPNSHQLFYGSGTTSDTPALNAHASIFTLFPTDPSTYQYNVYEQSYTIALKSNQVPAGYSNSSFLVKNVVAAVPEPGTWALMALGLGLLAVAGKRRRSA